MKIGVQFRLNAVILAAVVFGLAGCSSPDGGGGGGGGDKYVIKYVITIAAIQGVTAPVTGATPVRAITPTDQYTGTVTWSPNHPTFAVNTQYTATITLTAKTGYTLKGVEANFFTVEGASVSNAANSGVITAVFLQTGVIVAVSGVSLNKSSANLPVGAIETLTAAITPTNATNQNITWSSSNTSVATVSAGGVVTAVTVGTATIIVTTADGGKTASCTVTVSPIAVTGVSLNKPSTSLLVSHTETLFAFIEPDNATNQNVTWSSSNTSVATVSAGGVVTAVAIGTATVTVTTADGGKTASCTVTVSNVAVAVTDVSVNKSSASLVVGTIEELTAIISPANATNQIVTWSSNNTAVATVSAGGAVTAKNVGTAAITVTTDDGSKTASCTVTVNPKVITFTVDPITAQTYTGSPIQPVVTVRDGSTTLTLTTDYTATYTNNTNVGTATVTISGVGNYAGSSGSRTFTINPKVITFTVDAIAAQTYTGSAITPVVTVKDGSTILTPTTHYTVSYSNNTNAGTATVTISGAGNYAGSSGSATFTILQTVSPDRIEYYWVDQNDSLVTTSGGAVTVASGATLTITAQSTGYTVKQWHLDGVNTGQSGNTYNFSSAATGKHTVGLFVEKGGNLYNTNISITVLAANGSETNPFPLTAGTWENGSITSSASGSAVWYSFNVTSGTTYRVWWNDSYEGNSTKTLDVKVDAKYSNGTAIFTGVDSAYTSAQSFTANQTGTVKLKVYPYSSGNTGTFAVVYSTSSTRP